MKTVRELCQLQANALNINVSDQVEQLDQLIGDEADGRAFFEKTFITDGMKSLVSEAIARLAGKSNQAIFHLKQAMGGGKTHLLVGLGLLAKLPDLRREFCPKVAHINDFDLAKVAAFNGRNQPNSYFWGVIARQLGKEEEFKKYWTGGPEAPDEAAWLNLFKGLGPTLILLDEMPPYFDYYEAKPIGNGTVATIVTRAFSNLLSAAGKTANVCVVVSDLSAAYDSGSKLIKKALADAQSELGRQEKSITPVDLAKNEIYEILRKRLFTKLPSPEEIAEVAERFGRKLEEATKSKTVGRGAEEIADEIAMTYPFHPRLKNFIALFKENEKFRQTRGLIELVSRLLFSVWKRESNDVYLIGPQHFDLSLQEVRDKLTALSDMRDVVSRDLWDEQNSAHAQVIDAQFKNENASRVGALLFTASLSTSVNAVKGLTREEIVEALLNPLQEPSEFNAAFAELEKESWYLHHTPEERYYFDRQENLTKLLVSLAEGAPENQISDLIRKRLTDLFRPARREAYTEVLPLPLLKEASEKVRQNRVLLIISPELQDQKDKFFEDISQKNNLCVLSGEPTKFAAVEKAARQFYAAQKAESRIKTADPQREDLDKKTQQYDLDLTSTIYGLYDTVFYPSENQEGVKSLKGKSLDRSGSGTGEDYIIQTLAADPIKLMTDVEKEFTALCNRAEIVLWPANMDDARWSDVSDAYEQQPRMYWMPPKGLETLKTMACTRGKWEDLGGGYVTKKPKQKQTSVQVTVGSREDATGKVTLNVSALNAGPKPIIYYAEDGSVSEQSTVLNQRQLVTTALRVKFLVIDPTKQHETGEPVTWANQLKIKNRESVKESERYVELFVAPKGNIRYTLDGSEARNGTEYTGPIKIGDKDVRIWVFAEAEGIEARQEFSFAAKGSTGVTIDKIKPGRIVSQKGGFQTSTPVDVYAGLTFGKEVNAKFQEVVIFIGQGTECVSITIGKIPVSAAYLESLVKDAMAGLEPGTAITMSMSEVAFDTGHALEEFTKKLNIELTKNEVIQ